MEGSSEVKPRRRYPITHRDRCTPGRHFTVYPDLDRPHFTVEVYIARTPRHLREATMRQGFSRFVGEDESTAGRVINRTHSKRGQLYNGRIVAYMILDRKAVRTRRAEVIAHECGHAAMAWARYRNADLSKMGGGNGSWDERKRDGEEVLCYAIGELVKQVNRICFAARIWG